MRCSASLGGALSVALRIVVRLRSARRRRRRCRCCGCYRRLRALGRGRWVLTGMGIPYSPRPLALLLGGVVVALDGL